MQIWFPIDAKIEEVKTKGMLQTDASAKQIIQSLYLSNDISNDIV